MTPDIDMLLEHCRSDDLDLQAKALVKLLEAKIYDAVPMIMTLLSSPNTVIRNSAAHALGYLGIHKTEEVGPALMKLLTDSESIVRCEAVTALGILGYLPAVELTKALLRNDPDNIVRACAAEALGEMGDKSALKVLEDSLSEPDESVRAYAANSIGLLGASHHLSIIELYLKAEHSLRVKAELFGAKLRLGEAEDLNALIDLLETADEDLATTILNLLEDLVKRRVPPSVVTKASEIQIALTRTAQNFPLLSPHAEEITTRLTRLRSGSD